MDKKRQLEESKEGRSLRFLVESLLIYKESNSYYL